MNCEKYRKFPDFHALAQTLLADIESRTLNFTPTKTVDIISDQANNRLLELAKTCSAAYLVTGNTLTLCAMQQTSKIVRTANG